MDDLIIFCFATGDAEVPYWQTVVTVDHHDESEYEEFESFMSKHPNQIDDDLTGDDIAHDIMTAFGWAWEWFSAGSTIQDIHTYWL